MRLIRLLAASGLLWLARRADDSLDLLDPRALRSRLARLAMKVGRLCVSLAEWAAPWTRADYVQPALDDRQPTLREMALALARAKLARWRRALGRVAS